MTRDPRALCRGHWATARYNGRISREGSCADALAAGAISQGDLCPACTRWLIDAITEAAGRPVAWHRTYLARADPGVAE